MYPQKIRIVKNAIFDKKSVMYLIAKDYQVNIQDINIQQIIGNDESIRLRAQLVGEAEVQSWLSQKYDVSREFQDIEAFVFSKTYYAYNRFFLDANEYNDALNYAVNDLTLYDGDVYICINATTGTFVPADWQLLGVQYDIFHLPAPVPEFNYSNYYSINDQVFWKNKVYKCKVQTAVIDHDTAIQYRLTQNLPYINIPPDDPLEGAYYWTFLYDFSVTEELPTNTAYYSKSDNRDPQMVNYMCDIVLYHLHQRIAPRNIPELRQKRYDAAIDWLQMCARGEFTPKSPLITPKQGNRIRFGGQIRNINSY